MKTEHGSISINPELQHRRPQVTVRGYIDPTTLVDFVLAQREQFPEAEQTAEALNEGWDTLIKILSGGGVISGNGVIISPDMDMVEMPTPLLDLMNARGSVQLRNTDIRNEDIVIPSIPEDAKGRKIYAFAPDVRSRLGYKVTNNGLLLLYLQHPRRLEVLQDKNPLIKVFENVIRNLYDIRGLSSHLVAPATAVKQLLVETAEVYGIGRIGT